MSGTYEVEAIVACYSCQPTVPVPKVESVRILVLHRTVADERLGRDTLLCTTPPRRIENPKVDVLYNVKMGHITLGLITEYTSLPAIRAPHLRENCKPAITTQPHVIDCRGRGDETLAL